MLPLLLHTANLQIESRCYLSEGRQLEGIGLYMRVGRLAGSMIPRLPLFGHKSDLLYALYHAQDEHPVYYL